jgi:hypothetical protein
MAAMEEFWPLRCSIGGTSTIEFDGSTVHTAPCLHAPTHRYRSAAHPDRPWSYRCAQYVGWLDTKICTVEALAEVSQ